MLLPCFYERCMRTSMRLQYTVVLTNRSNSQKRRKPWAPLDTARRTDARARQKVNCVGGAHHRSEWKRDRREHGEYNVATYVWRDDTAMAAMQSNHQEKTDWTSTGMLFVQSWAGREPGNNKELYSWQWWLPTQIGCNTFTMVIM